MPRKQAARSEVFSIWFHGSTNMAGIRPLHSPAMAIWRPNCETLRYPYMIYRCEESIGKNYDHWRTCYGQFLELLHVSRRLRANSTSYYSMPIVTPLTFTRYLQLDQANCHWCGTAETWFPLGLLVSGWYGMPLA